MNVVFAGTQWLYNSFCPKILNCFRELQERNGIVPEENGFHEYAECYGVVDREPDESLLLEDLKEAGFVMIDHRKDRVTIDHARLVFDALGKFHALSFALRDQQPDKFRDLAERIPEILLRLNNSDALRGYFDWLKGLVYSAIDESESSTLVKIKEKIDDSLFEVGAAMVDGAAAEPYAVICHGDCWINNILFHFDEVSFSLKKRSVLVGYFYDVHLSRQRIINRYKFDFWTCNTADMLHPWPI